MGHPALPAIALALLIVFAAVMTAHAPVLEARALSFDDGEYLRHNPLVTRPSFASALRFFVEVERPSTFTGYYHPLSMVLLMLGHAAGGRPDEPFAWHAISLALHAANAGLVMLIVLRLFGALVPAAIAALLFALHPLTVEPVAWIGEQKTLLSACFALAAILAHLRRVESGQPRWAWATAGFTAGALLAKPTAVPLPALLLVLDAWPLRRFGWHAIREKWPLFALSAASAVVTLVSQQNVGGITASTAADLARWPLRVFYVLAFDLRKLVWPFPLSSAYPQPEPLALSHPAVWGSLVAVILVTLAAVLALRRTRAPLAAWLFFVLALSPTLTPVQYTWAISFDQYVYLPATGFVLLVGASLSRAWAARRPARLVLALAVCGVAAAQFSGVRGGLAAWRDSVTLFRHMEAIAPRSPVVHNQLGVHLAAAGDSAAAVAAFERAVALEPRYGGARYNLGLALAGAGRLDEAIAHFREAVALLPGDADAAFNLGVALWLSGDARGALEPLKHAVRSRPDHVEALARLGAIEAGLGSGHESVAHFREAVRHRSDDPRLRYQLASALTLAGAPVTEVARELEEAVRLRPDWAVPLNDLAWLRATNPDSAVRDAAAAVDFARRALAAGGREDAGLLDTYAVALAAGGDFSGAAATAREAIQRAGLAGRRELAAAVRARLAVYERQQPFLEPWGAGMLQPAAPGTPVRPPGP